MINLEGKKLVIVGGDKAAYNVIAEFVDYKPLINVIAPAFNEDIKKLAAHNTNINLLKKKYEPNDIRGAFLVIGASSVKELNQQVQEDAASKNIMVNNINALKISDFLIPSKIDQGYLTIAISTNGKSPILDKKIKQDLINEFGSHYAQFIEMIADVKASALSQIEDESIRTNLFEKLVYSDILDLIKEGKTLKAKEKAKHIVMPYTNG